jgi:hypothetical protein
LTRVYNKVSYRLRFVNTSACCALSRPTYYYRLQLGRSVVKQVIEYQISLGSCFAAYRFHFARLASGFFQRTCAISPDYFLN